MSLFKQPSAISAQARQASVPSTSPTRSTFNRSHTYKTTFDASKLIPIFVDEVMPGDTYDVDLRSLCRLATPLKPFMDNLYLDVHWWFVPSRLPWSKFQQFMGERIDPDDNPNDLVYPKTTITLGNIQPNSLAAYFAIPPRTGGGAVQVASIPFLAYCQIWNDWYRDENFQESIKLDTVNATFPGPSGLNAHDSSSILPRGKRKDYFTGALPWPQKGDPVPLPIGGFAPVEIPGAPMTGTAGVNTMVDGSGTPQSSSGGVNYSAPSTSNFYIAGVPGSDSFLTGSAVTHSLLGAHITDPGSAIADLSAASAITINDFRTAYMLQLFLERDARGGTRYVETLLNQFDVVSPDARLQRPEFLGGGTIPVNINPIAQNSASISGQTPQGNLSAMGTAVGSVGFKHSFVEHGYVIGLVCARADLTYQAGIERFWSRETRFDFPFPAFAHLGEQAILNKELYADGSSTDNGVWGYQERYAEMRYKPSRITGLFASEAPSSLDVWHLSQDFSALPPLNASFIEENVPLDRVIAVNTEPHFLADFWIQLNHTRVLPIFGVPGLGGPM